jgi:hypothetical protein
MVGLRVVNLNEEEIGRIEAIMIDTGLWRVSYAVLSLVPLMGMGDRLFPVPWRMLRPELQERRVILELHREHLKTAPCFLKNDWPRMADREWAREIHGFYSERPYWEEATAERRGPSPGRRETDGN